jgi:uncharacterized protein with GYD domain
MWMLFITLGRFRRKPTKQMLAEMQKLFEQGAKEGKVLGFYWTLGRYDGVVLSESPDEKSHMKHMLRFVEFVATETLVAVPVEEAGRLVE